MIKPLVITSGEPAGIGPDIILQLAQQSIAHPYTVIADPFFLKQRAQQLNLPLKIELLDGCEKAEITEPGTLNIFPLLSAQPVVAGKLCVENADYVIKMLNLAVNACVAQEASALITAPVNKAILNQAGISFVGHTHYFAQKCNVSEVSMFFTSPTLNLALVTDHLPLAQVSKKLTHERIKTTIQQTAHALQYYFKKNAPHLAVCGLNPHAGENGYLGKEEIHMITPAIQEVVAQGYHVTGPISADSAFTVESLKKYDAIIAMYHDQGLPVLKHLSFGKSVNITLGLPFLRTSVDHGTALDLAGTGKANSDSLLYAVNTTIEMLHASSPP